MDKEKIKGALQKLSFFKDYSSLIIPVVLILVAVLLLGATVIVKKKLVANVEKKSINSGKRVKSEIGNVISKDQYLIEEKFQDAYMADATEIKEMAIATAKRELLSYDIFPDTNDTSSVLYTEFGTEYIKKIHDAMEKLQARGCPTELELSKIVGITSLSSSSKNQGTDVQKAKEMRENDLCNDIAGKLKIYMDKETMPGYSFWEEYDFVDKNTAISQCWNWQTAYWIMEDVFDTVYQMDQYATNVFDAPVKRIMGINFDKKSKNSGGSSRTNNTSANNSGPKYVKEITKDSGIVQPYSARICDDEVDVVHFRLSVIINVTDVPMFLEQLCSAKEHLFYGFKKQFDDPKKYKHNQITVLDFSLSPIDTFDETHKLYRYGQKPVAQLDVVCEYVFISKGYESVIPSPIRAFISKNAETK